MIHFSISILELIWIIITCCFAGAIANENDVADGIFAIGFIGWIVLTIVWLVLWFQQYVPGLTL